MIRPKMQINVSATAPLGTAGSGIAGGVVVDGGGHFSCLGGRGSGLTSTDSTGTAGFLLILRVARRNADSNGATIESLVDGEDENLVGRQALTRKEE